MRQRGVTNFSLTTITANEDSDSFSPWLAAFGSVSIQHCFGGTVIKNNLEEAIIEVNKMIIYIRDGFDFSGGNQPLGKWENKIFYPSFPSIDVMTYLNNEGEAESTYITNQKMNNFQQSYGIGKNFSLFLNIPIDILFSKIIINKKTNEIIYQK